MLKLISIKKNIFFVILIFVFATTLFLRFYKLNTIPQGVLDDEASFGYIAYSLLHTAKDERGSFMPLHFQAFGDEKLPAYAYVLIPVVKIFGLNNFATRFPSAFAGALLVLAIFAMLRALGLSERASIFGAFITAFSPWTIVLSRFAFESNVALLLFVIGLYSIFSSFHSKKLYDPIVAVLCFAASWYIYVPYRFVTTLIFLVYLFLAFKEKLYTPIRILGLVCIAGLFILPLLPHTLGGRGATRLNQVGLFSNSGIVFSINDRRGYCVKSVPSFVCSLLANKPLVITQQILSNQIRSLSPEFLFLNGEKDILYLSVAEYGVLPIVLLPFFILGIIVLIDKMRHWHLHPSYILVAFALFFTTLPAALVGGPQRVRLSALVPFLVVIIVLGYGFVLSSIASRKAQVLFQVISWVLVVGMGCMFMIDFYFVHIPKLKIDYESDIPGVMKYIHSHTTSETVYFEKFNNNFPMLYAYHNAINPIDYQANAKYSKPDSGGFTHPIGYKNLMRPNKPLPVLICEKYSSREKFYYITTEPVKDMGIGLEKPVYTEVSGDERSAISFVYHIDPLRYKKQCSVK